MDILNCKLVCHRWLELTMTSFFLRKHRSIHLCKFLIEMNRPPASIFMNQVHPYDSIVLHNHERYTPLFRNFEQVKSFWEHMGESVCHLKVSHFEKDVCLIMTEMKNIKVLNIEDQTLQDFVKFLELNQSDVENSFTSLGKLKFKYTVVDSLQENLTYLKTTIPTLQEIDCGIVYFDNLDSMTNIVDTLKTLKIHKIEIPDEALTEELKQSLVETKDLQFKSLRVLVRNDFNFLNNFMNDHPEVANLELCSYYIPLSTYAEKITFLSLTVTNRHSISLGPLSNLKNLKVLDFSCLCDTGCCFGHEPINQNVLKKLTVYWKSFPCTRCFTALSKSFLNLKYFECRIEWAMIMAIPIQRSFFYNWTNLETFKMICHKVIFELGNIIQGLDCVRPQMKHFQLECRLKVEPLDFVIMHKMFPNLHTLIFDFDSKWCSDLDSIIQNILPRFHRMACLRIDIHDCFYKIPQDTAKRAIFWLAENGKSLRDISFPTLQDINRYTVGHFLFEKLPQLNYFGIFCRRYGPIPISSWNSSNITLESTSTVKN